MRLNIDRDLVKQMVSGQLPNRSPHLDELTHEPAMWSCDTGQWLSCFDSCQLTILWMSNIQDVDLPRHAWDTDSSLLMVSPIPPLQSVDAYLRTYLRSVNHVTAKRKEVDQEKFQKQSSPSGKKEKNSESFWVKLKLKTIIFVQECGKH